MSNNLTMTNPTYDTSAQKYGTAALNGGHGSTVVPVLPPSGDFMVQAWVKTTDTAVTMVAVAKADAFWIGKSGNFAAAAQYGSSTNAVDLVTSVAINNGVWHHLRLEVSATTGGKFYVDGVLAASSAITPAAAIVQYQTRVFEVRTLLYADFADQFTWIGSVDDVAVFSAVNGSNFTPAQVSPSAPNLLVLYALDSNGNDTTVSTVSIFPNNVGFVYSPYTWDVTSVRAKSINSGSYFRTLFSGNSCVLNFDVSNASAPVPQIWSRIDATGPWVQSLVASTVTLTTFPANTAWPRHLLEVVIKSTAQTVNRWNAPQNTAVVFTGLTLDSGATLVTPVVKPKTILFYGDSIFEGVRAINNTAPVGTDQDDAMLSSCPEVARFFGSEFGLIGFGSQGFTSVASGNVPTIQLAYNFLWSGVARVFSPQPDLVVIAEGVNDGSNNIIASATSLLNGLLAACTTAPIVVLRPFRDTAQSANWQAAIAGCNTPSRVHFVDTAGFFNSANSSDALHPYGFENITSIAPAVAAAIKPYLSGVSAPQRGFAF